MKTISLIILDGWGMAPPWGGNAVFVAKTPCFDELWRFYPKTTLGASGEAVGLSGHAWGNSEAGHLNIGAGKIVHQDVSHISSKIKDGSFFQNPVLSQAALHVKKNHSHLHLLGLVSDGGIHSHIDHLFALLEFFKKEGLKEVYIHAFTDGRDTPPSEALSYISQLEKECQKLKIGEIVSISGRYYAMDRDKRWERTEKAYQAIAKGIGIEKESALSAISSAYKRGETDEFISPSVIVSEKRKKIKVKDNDALIFFNVRGDRARQLTWAFTDPRFRKFKREKYKNLFFVIFTWYGEEIPQTKVAFPPEEVKRPLARVLSENNLSQFHIAETEKYAHITYFFNGGREEPFPKEERLMIPSPKVPTYDLKPEMSAKKISEKVIEKLNQKKYNFIVLNYANPDMVGHTGNFKAAVKAVETVDQELARVLEKIKEKGDLAIVTADHGNIEQMVNPKTGAIDTEHTNNPVPFILFDPSSSNLVLREGGILADIAPTILKLLGLKKPLEMTGESLV